MCPDPKGQAHLQQSPAASVAADAARDQDTGNWYAEHVRTVLGAAGWPWPQSSVLDACKRPRFVHSVEAFLSELQYGCHLDEIVVFPDGLRQLGQHEAFQPQLLAAVGGGDAASSEETPVLSAYDALRSLDEANMLSDLKGKVAFQRLRGTGSDVEPGRQDSAGGRSNRCLAEKWAALQAECPKEARERIYIAELRRQTAQEVNGRRRKSTLSTTMRERLELLGQDIRRMLYWDDYSEGVFIGGDCAGYRFHVDCMQTSNVGSLYQGHKLMAIWKYPEETKAAMGEHYDEIFTPPLSSSQLRALDSACCIALAPPGSVYIFSGANAHVVCNVGFCNPPAPGEAPRRCLCAASYEAFVNLHPRHAGALAATNTDLHWEECWLDDDDMDDFEDDVADNIQYIVRKLIGVASQEEARRMREAVASVCAGSPSIRRLVHDKLESYAEECSREAASGEMPALEVVEVPATAAATEQCGVSPLGVEVSPPTETPALDECGDALVAGGGSEKRRRIDEDAGALKVDISSA